MHKNIFCSINGKKTPDSETYKELRRLRNLVNRRLREAHNSFCIDFFQKLATSKEKWKFIKQNTSPNERIVKVDEIRFDSGEISREPKNIVNCLNRSFDNLGVFKGLDIACKYPDKLNIPEFAFRTLTSIQSLTRWTITKQQGLVKSQLDS